MIILGWCFRFILIHGVGPKILHSILGKTRKKTEGSNPVDITCDEKDLMRDFRSFSTAVAISSRSRDIFGTRHLWDRDDGIHSLRKSTILVLIGLGYGIVSSVPILHGTFLGVTLN